MNNSIRYGVATAALQHCERHDQFHPLNEQCPWCPPVVSRKNTYQKPPAVALGNDLQVVVHWLYRMETASAGVFATPSGPFTVLYRMKMWLTASKEEVQEAISRIPHVLMEIEPYAQQCGYTLHRLAPDLIPDPNELGG